MNKLLFSHCLENMGIRYWSARGLLSGARAALGFEIYALYGMSDEKRGILCLASLPMKTAQIAPASRLLDAMLSAVQLKRGPMQEEYLPQENRSAVPAEIAGNCFLYKPQDKKQVFVRGHGGELPYLPPDNPPLPLSAGIAENRFILVMGHMLALNLLDKSEENSLSLDELRMANMYTHHQGEKILVTYHPLELLMDPSCKAKAWEDLKMLRGLYSV